RLNRRFLEGSIEGNPGLEQLREAVGRQANALSVPGARSQLALPEGREVLPAQAEAVEANLSRALNLPASRGAALGTV
ncbi:MAG: hypothetical protein ABSD56_11160, partial [Bryobacteraceae bacterium]